MDVETEQTCDKMSQVKELADIKTEDQLKDTHEEKLFDVHPKESDIS